MNKRLRWFILVFLLVGAVQSAERFIPEPFTNGWSSSAWGPAIQANGGSGVCLCSDREGNIYLGGSKSYQYIDIITTDGMRYHIAGTGENGFRDGLAKYAMFKMGIRGGEYGDAFSIGCHSDGSVFIGDNGNARVRRLYKNGEDNEWYVETWAGGGSMSTSSIAIGQTVSAKAIALPGSFQIAVNKHGVVFVVSPWGGNYMISATGDSITRLSVFPVAAGSPLNNNYPGALQRGASDTVGNVYFGARTPDRVWKIDSTGTISHIGINPDLRSVRPPDGPPLAIYFDTQTSLAASPDGSCVYVCGGDEYRIVRIPTDLTTYTSQLARNGFFFSSTEATKGWGQYNTFQTNGSGTTNLTVCHVAGNDINGNFYGWVYSWNGNGMVIDGKTPQSARFRLRRVVE